MNGIQIILGSEIDIFREMTFFEDTHKSRKRGENDCKTLLG